MYDRWSPHTVFCQHMRIRMRSRLILQTWAPLKRSRIRQSFETRPIWIVRQKSPPTTPYLTQLIHNIFIFIYSLVPIHGFSHERKQQKLLFLVGLYSDMTPIRPQTSAISSRTSQPPARCSLYARPSSLQAIPTLRRTYCRQLNIPHELVHSLAHQYLVDLRSWAHSFHSTKIKRRSQHTHNDKSMQSTCNASTCLSWVEV
jgi:hypothetical protein